MEEIHALSIGELGALGVPGLLLPERGRFAHDSEQLYACRVIGDTVDTITIDERDHVMESFKEVVDGLARVEGDG